MSSHHNFQCSNANRQDARRMERERERDREHHHTYLLRQGRSHGLHKYRGFKLLSPNMKPWERIIGQRPRSIVSISARQCSCNPGVGTTDAIFVIMTLCEKYMEGNKPLDMVFVDLENPYDTVSRELLLWRCMRKRYIPEE